ncbi:alpha/beta fold hydrolase [Phenylobacterium sp. VNQ135]|uniref:alpha/beta fold hydrolase n=1 Tax=Phenylobacterium sp. VNQ135 TaxID=3400922 RepID=UPI003C0F01C4
MDAVKTRSFVEPCPGTPGRRELPRLAMNAVQAGQGRPVVFIHGLGWDHSLWGGAMTRLLDRYLTIAGDTRGHGASDKPEGPYSVDLFADDWADLISSLTDEKVLIVGFSLGGMIAQTLALEHPDRVGALVLVNTSCRSPAHGQAHMKARMSAMQDKGPQAAAMLAAESVFSKAWRDAHPTELADFVDWRVAQDHRALGEAMRAASSFDVCDRVGALGVPVLVITALGDELMAPADQALLRTLIPHAEYAEIDRSGHMVPIEQAEAFEQALEAFLARHWPSAGEANDGAAAARVDGIEEVPQ